MNKAIFKWVVFCITGIGILFFALVCYFRQTYTWIMAAVFVGCFLVSVSWKRIRLLIRAGKALKAGKGAIVIDYRDKNLKESQTAVIPAGEDRFYFYGFVPEKNRIKFFRWERIRRAEENGKELNKDDILRSIAALTGKTPQ